MRLWNRVACAAMALAFPISALADLSQTATLTTAAGSLNLDTGATAASGGDLLWDGSALSLLGNATEVAVGTAGTLNGFSKSVLDGFKPAAKSWAIPSNGLTVGQVFAVFTNGGNTAGVLVTANSGGSITLQFTTFGAAGSAPVITSALNNSSNILPGYPNSGIAPSSLIKILGSGLSDPGDATVHSSEGTGLQITLNGASVTVTAGTTTVHPALYYATPTQIDAVLPASTPTGSATLTVAYNGVTSNPLTIDVVASAPGLTTFSDSGYGSAVAQHASPVSLITYTSSAAPGETIILWGTGLGADPADSDTTYTGTPHQTSVPYTVYIGGLQADIVYQGASVYPGVSVFGVTIPQSVLTGCYVPVAAVTGNVVSHIVTLPIHAGGGVCSDPQLGISGDQISTSTGTTIVKTGNVAILQWITYGPGAQSSSMISASGTFLQSTVLSGTGSGLSIGGCGLSQFTPNNGPVPPPTGLDAGTITVTGPDGSPVTLTLLSSAGKYNAILSSMLPTGAAYVFNGSGGADVGPFTATVSLPNPLLVWTNPEAAATVTRSQGVTVTWSGGIPGSYVIIGGNSGSPYTTASFRCLVPQSAGQFTVPPYVLLGMPSGLGGISIQNLNQTPISAAGVDSGTAAGTVLASTNSTYN